jgi:hypothetical protein
MSSSPNRPSLIVKIPLSRITNQTFTTHCLNKLQIQFSQIDLSKIQAQQKRYQDSKITRYNLQSKINLPPSVKLTPKDPLAENSLTYMELKARELMVAATTTNLDPHRKVQIQKARELITDNSIVSNRKMNQLLYKENARIKRQQKRSTL